jgi:diguanylate cyclase (GGDEF)-like protein
MNENVQFLKTVEIFSLLSDGEIEMIIENFRFKDIAENEELFKEGDDGNEMFIIKDGTVKTSIKMPDGNEKELALFKNGDFFGEMSIFENAPRSATCKTVEKTSVISLQEDDLFSMIENNPEIAIKMMYRMLNITTQRLRDTGEFLSDMVQWGEAARKRTITDEFTGAYNRRFLDDALPEYYETARKNKKPLSFIMVDLDYFREINNHFGHELGDKVILEVVNVFKQHLRESDILARYGGDEFSVLMPETGVEDAKEIAEKIRKDVADLDMLDQQDAPIKQVTTSQGLSSYPENSDSLDELKELADKALYKAKEDGRNRVGYINK